MQDIKRTRNVGDLLEDFDGLRSQFERIGDNLAGMAILFGAVAALVLAGGVLTRAPAFALSAGVAFAAALAFAVLAHMAVQASHKAPRLQPVRVAARRFDSRRAA